MYSDTHCLQTSLLIFKFCQPQNKRTFVSTANKRLVGTLMTIGDVTVSIALGCVQLPLPSGHYLYSYQCRNTTISRFATLALRMNHHSPCVLESQEAATVHQLVCRYYTLIQTSLFKNAMNIPRAASDLPYKRPQPF